MEWADDGFVPTDTDKDGLPDTGCGDSVTLTIDDPFGSTDWTFGMAETGSVGGWFGEDCFGGYASFYLCHPISGTSLALDEVTSCAASDVVAGATTLLDASREPAITYFLLDVVQSVCFAWGHDPSYYSALGCRPL